MNNRPRVGSVGAVVVLAAIVALPSMAFGQRTTTGTVTGKVVDSSGAVLSGVIV